MVTKTSEEISDMRERVERGELPKSAIKDYLAAEEANVFGHDHKKDRKGQPVEQGMGSKGHETANHFAAILRAEQLGQEPEGAYQAALAEIWHRDPKHAEKLRLPRPKKPEKTQSEKAA